MNISSSIQQIIAGPCSAESEDQVLKTAIKLEEISHVKLYRAGLWKPRTRPGSFEGVGSKGLPWLKRVQIETRLDVITEVANVKHIDFILNSNINNIWIGSRTSTNPFSIQEISEAIKGTNISVYVKNPIVPDLDLWIGAIERFQRMGIKEITAVHRGVYNINEMFYRNDPNWDLALRFKNEMPQIPIICDPSHIAGNGKKVYGISQHAKNLKCFSGFMIETHFEPELALSDSKQQITPQLLKKIIRKLEL